MLDSIATLLLLVYQIIIIIIIIIMSLVQPKFANALLCVSVKQECFQFHSNDAVVLIHVIFGAKNNFNYVINSISC